MELLEFLSNVSTWSIIIFVIGIILIVFEMFNPGFGVAGGIGIFLLVVDILITAKTFVQGLIMAAVLASLLVVLLSLSIYLASKGYLPRKLILSDSTSSETGFSAAEDMQYLLGKTGTAITTLRPSGNVDFDGVRLDVVSRGEFISPGAEVEVVEVEGNRIVVREKD
ncbi:MAG: NfeD family protein [Eubacteriales bacterium]